MSPPAPTPNTESCQALSILFRSCIYIFLSIPTVAGLPHSLKPVLINTPPHPSPILQAILPVIYPVCTCQINLTKARIILASSCLKPLKAPPSLPMHHLCCSEAADKPHPGPSYNTLTLPRTFKPLRKAIGQGPGPLSLLDPYSTTPHHPLPDLCTILITMPAPGSQKPCLIHSISAYPKHSSISKNFFNWLLIIHIFSVAPSSCFSLHRGELNAITVLLTTYSILQDICHLFSFLF